MKWVFSLLIPILFSGCGALYYLSESPEHKKTREGGYELCHIQSCGPAALEEAFFHLNIKKSQEDIGKEIQDLDHTHYRNIISLFSHDFTRITCPPELFKYCRSQGLVVKKTDYNKLSDGDVAIILIKGRSDISDWHWISWPKHSRLEIESFFNENTEIISTHLLTKQGGNK